MATAVPTVLARPRPRRRRPRAPAAVTLPAIIVAGLTVLPIAYLVVRAVAVDGGIWSVVFAPRTARLLLNSLLLAASVTVTTVVISVPLGWLVDRTDLPGARWWAVLTAMPLVVPSYVGGFVVATALGPTGMLQQLLQRLWGVTRLPDIYGLAGAWLVLSLFTFPYVLLSVRAGLRGIDPALEEASRSLGHSGRESFMRVTLPLLRPWIGAGALLVALYVASDFGAVSMMQFETFTTAIYVQYLASFNRSYAAALALVLVALTAVLLAAEARGVQARYHRIGTATARRPRQVALGRWRWAALFFCAIVVMLGLAIPVGVIVYWLVNGLRHGEPLTLALRPAMNSVVAAALGSGATVLAALPVAVLAVRYNGFLGVIVSRLAYAGYAFPGIVVALSLVFFSARYTGPLYQSLAVLVIAYVVLFLPQAAGTVRSALLQVSPSQEEAARTLGRTAPQALWTITVPLCRPGVTAAAALVFLTVMKELPATLLLSPIGFDTLATRIWSAATEGFFARAAMPALVLLLVSSLSMALVLSQERRSGGVEPSPP
jgi:iron(III) transport system permease protein